MARLLALALLTCALLLVGCGTGKDEGVVITSATPPPAAADIDKQIAEIQANTHMPDIAKQASISRLQQTKATIAARPK